MGCTHYNYPESSNGQKDVIFKKKKVVKGNSESSGKAAKDTTTEKPYTKSKFTIYHPLCYQKVVYLLNVIIYNFSFPMCHYRQIHVLTPLDFTTLAS